MQQNMKVKHIYCFITTIIIFKIIFVYNSYYLRQQNSTGKTFSTAFAYKTVTSQTDRYTQTSTDISRKDPRLDAKNKHILLWTNPNNSPFVYLRTGNDVFRERNCKFTNCFVTNDREYLGDYSVFHAILFHGPELLELIGRRDVSEIRSAHQKYVFVNIEAAVSYPVCSITWNGFFNLTWTYKLNSDAIWGYFVIKNASNHVIGPTIDIKWMKEDKMATIDDGTRAKLDGKSKAVAWFVSNCETKSLREKYVLKFEHYINAYDLNVDIYGKCGDIQCPRNEMNACLDKLGRDYYFYFAFENALSEDYVTEKVLHALKHYTVPVVYGGANYSRFLPPGSYLDALELGPELLAARIHELIKKPELYHKFFRWRRYYSYHFRYESPMTDDYCGFCAMLNNDTLMKHSFAYENFSNWWSESSTCGYK